MKKIINSLLLLFVVQAAVYAQTKGFMYHARLDTVKKAGFYNIEITPEVNAHVKSDYSDARIVNDSGKWVPHLLRLPASDIRIMAVLMEMPFERKEVSAGAVTCVVKNKLSDLSVIELLMRNTTAQRVCSISGSFDDINWFIINDSIMLQAVAQTDGDKTKCRISFPPSSYPYIKVVVDSKKTDPVNIISISAPTTAYSPGRKLYEEVLENPNCTITQKDSAKTSYIQVTQQQAYQFEQLSMLVSGVKYFNRRVDMYVPGGEDHSFASPGRLHQSFTVSNNSSLQFALPQVKTKVFYLLVHNDDNLPLTVTKVKTALRYRVLTAYLEKGVYRLLAGNEKIEAPVYDLTQLTAKLSDSIAILAAGELVQEKNSIEEPMIAPKSDSRLMIWLSIGLVLLLLLLFTVRLTREVNKKKAAEAGREIQ
jgi:hypothetical protein